MNIDEARKFVANATWVFAKSYANTYPHEYTTRDRVKNDSLFESFISFARDHSILKTFHAYQYLCFELDGIEYWEMGRPLKAIVVLNRAPINDDKPYRHPAPADGDRDRLLNKLKARDLYLENLLAKDNASQEDKDEIAFLLNSRRGSPNRIQHSNQRTKEYSL